MVNANFQVKRRPIEKTNGAINLVEVTIDKESREYWKNIARDVRLGKDVTFNAQLLQQSAEYVSVFLYVLCGDWEWRNVATLECVSKEILPDFSWDKFDAFYYLEYVGKRTKAAFVEACKVMGYGGFVIYIPTYGWISTTSVDEEYRILDDWRPLFRNGSYFD